MTVVNGRRAFPRLPNAVGERGRLAATKEGLRTVGSGMRRYSLVNLDMMSVGVASHAVFDSYVSDQDTKGRNEVR